MRHKASFYPFSGPASLFLHHGILSDEEINQLFLSWRHLSMNSQKHLSYAKLKKDGEFYKALNWCFSPSVEIFFVLCPDWSCSWHQLKAWWPFYPHIGFIWCHYFINNFRHLCGRQRKRTVENHFRKSPFNYKIIESRLSLLHPDSLLRLLKDHSPERKAVLVVSCLRWNTVFLA